MKFNNTNCKSMPVLIKLRNIMPIKAWSCKSKLMVFMQMILSWSPYRMLISSLIDIEKNFKFKSLWDFWNLDLPVPVLGQSPPFLRHLPIGAGKMHIQQKTLVMRCTWPQECTKLTNQPKDLLIRCDLHSWAIKMLFMIMNQWDVSLQGNLCME